MLLERGYVHVETLLGGYFDYRQHFITLRELFLSNHWGYGSSALGPVDDLALSTGIIHWILGLGSVAIAALSLKKNRKIPLLILGFGVIELAVLFLMHERSSFVWALIKPLSWLQFPWRFLSLSVFILSFMSAFVISSLGKASYLAGILIICGLFVLHGSFFTPKTWLNVTDKDELTGAMWEKELTASIFDYLPIYAKLPPDSKAPDLPEVVSGNAIFVTYKKGSNYQGGLVKVIDGATIRVPLYDFPGMEVQIDGKKVNHVHDNCDGEKVCLGLITFDISEGDHKLLVILKNTPVRTIGNVLTLLSGFGLLTWSLKKNEKISKK